jgi:hypothetical protein
MLTIEIEAHVNASLETSLCKLANHLFAQHLQKIFDAEGTQALAISVHPGDVKTVNEARLSLA